MRAVLPLFLLGWSGFLQPLQAQTPQFNVVADPGAGFGAVVHAAGVLGDDALEQAVRSGLPLRLRFRAELWRDRLVDQLVDQQIWSAVLMYEPLEARFTVRTPGNPGTRQSFASYGEARALVETHYPLSLRPSRAGRYYYVAVLEIETLSLSDLEELETWLRGELRPAVAGERSVTGAVGQGLKRAVIRLLRMPTRRFDARSPKFDVR